MLQAKTADGTLVTLSTLTKQEINKLKQKGVLFYCPSCNQQVIMKAGLKMIAHFAHRSLTACPSGEGGEGVYHERGKLLLYQWLKKQGIPTQLEAYLPEIRQRPDLLLRINRRKIALEYQCASISTKEVIKRTAGYKSTGIIPIWILGGNRVERINKTHFKLNHQLLPFIHQFSSTTLPALFFFSSDTSHFISIQDIYLTGKTIAMGKFSIQQSGNISFKDLFKEHAFHPKDLYTLWEKEKYRFRIKNPRKLYGQELAWHQWLYAKGLHRERLPAMIHLPVLHPFKMKSPPWNWQSRLLLDMIDPMAIGTEFTVKRVHHFLRSHLYPPNHFPLIQFDTSPINEYLRLLSNVNVIKQGQVGKFIKINPVNIPETMEEAVKADKRLLYDLATQR